MRPHGTIGMRSRSTLRLDVGRLQNPHSLADAGDSGGSGLIVIKVPGVYTVHFRPRNPGGAIQFAYKVAGGGGGSGGINGGGGAGVAIGSGLSINGDFPLVVGAGGAALNSPGGDGNPSSIGWTDPVLGAKSATGAAGNGAGPNFGGNAPGHFGGAACGSAGHNYGGGGAGAGGDGTNAVCPGGAVGHGGPGRNGYGAGGFGVVDGGGSPGANGSGSTGQSTGGGGVVELDWAPVDGTISVT